MRILVTGIPGWLGNRFIEILVKGFDKCGPINDWKIRCLVQKDADISIIKEFSKLKRIECIDGDITKIDSITKAVKDVDLVYHLAGIIHPKKVKQFYEVNSQGTENMLKRSIESSVKRFIYISSNSVGGVNKNRNLLMQETEPPKPYMNYGLSKYKAECTVKNFQSNGSIETVILRPCWFYGPYQSARQTQFFRMIKKGDAFIFGDGNNLRSMSYIDNVCRAMLLAAENRLANGQTYWIADRRPYTYNEIYETIAELLEVKNFRPIHLPNLFSGFFHAADKIIQNTGCYIKEIHVASEMYKNISCSIEKAKKELGYNPEIELKEGLRRSIDWCRNNGIKI